MKRGFTIIELLVAISIFIVVTGLVVANFRRGARSDELKIAAAGLANTLRRAQTMALAGETINGALPLGGYGVYVTLDTPNRYIIFADRNNDKIYGVGEELAGGINFLPPSIAINQVSPVSVSVVFKPPKPTIYIDGGTSENLVMITLKDSISGQTRKVTVNRISGQISME
jgi:prepilin-type N-terminal cleavage/methylation domain-containing protein